MKILLLGGTGQVGWELRRALSPLGELVVPTRVDADLADPGQLRSLVRHVRPKVLVNAAAYTRVDDAERDADLAWRINAEAVGVLAEASAVIGALMVHYSTDYVFDGRKRGPYVEDDLCNPLNSYGRGKLEGERLLRESRAHHVIFRTSWVYANRGRNFPDTILRAARENASLEVVEDQVGAPTHAELVADVTALVLHQLDRSGAASQRETYNLASAGSTTWYEFAHCILTAAQDMGMPLRCRPEHLRAIASQAREAPATRPANSTLDTGKLEAAFGLRFPHWRHHLERWLMNIKATAAGV